MYPATLELRRLVRAAAGDIIVHPGDANAGTVGTAFDILSGFLLIDDYVPLNPPTSHVWRPVYGLIAQRLTEYAHEDKAGRATDDDFYRYIWVLAELASIVRGGHANPDSALEKAVRDAAGIDALLGITPDDGIRQLRELEAVAAEHLYPHLEPARKAPVAFPAVRDLVQAEADIIAGDMLLDFKSGTSAPHQTTGARAFFPTSADIYQILGYALMDDPDDGYGINAVGFYAARFGHSSVWELPQLLGITAGGHAVNVDAARAWFRSALEADYNAVLSNIMN
ncbi:hypothetical protein GCM10007198_19350 [Microbacterium aerolatum]|uniref:PD-(D/E)XK endonuclease-like domain-containing protein n=2 Tax=Microbacterium aerolatum TaxID=153731 RepID=A0A511AEV1_9MICO|nr:hypothetical protein MAE01_03470 [Microbacterium aerolatum]GGB28983.1 hypothetical protein GCM10007198_19350 [Microbacterium aerolatum]